MSPSDAQQSWSNRVDSRFFLFAAPFLLVYGWALWLGLGRGQCDTSGIFREKKFVILCLWAAAAAVFHYRQVGAWSWSRMATGALAGGLTLGLSTVVLSLLSSHPFVSPGSVSLLFYSGIAGLFAAHSSSHRGAALLGVSLLFGQVALDLGVHLPWSCVY